MKITSTQYARSLYELTAGKSQPEVDAVVANFLKVLQKNNQLKLADQIMERFSEIYNRENGMVEAEVATRYKIQDTMTKQIEDFLKKKYRAKEVVLKNVVDEKIGGGVVIRVGDEIIDGSIANQLKELKNKLSK